MSQAQTESDLHFEAPGPGTWKLDAVHFPRPVTRYWAETHPEPFRRGFGEFTRFYGMLIDTLDTAYPNGFSYTMMRPAAPEDVPARLQRAEEVFEGKLWREQLSEWDDDGQARVHRGPPRDPGHRPRRPRATPSSPSYLSALPRAPRRDDHAAHALHGGRDDPHRRLARPRGAWTGLPAADLLGLLRGAAPVSAGASAELEQLVDAVGDDPRARELLDSGGDPAQVLDALRALDGDTGRAVNAYLDLVGWRLLDGFDISGPCALELPDALLRAIRAAAEGREDETASVEEHDRGGPRQGPRGASRASSTSSSGRRGSCTGSATNGESSATSGPRA